MYYTTYTKIFLFLSLFALLPSVNANNYTNSEHYFNNIFQQLKNSVLLQEQLIMPEICDNGIDDDGDGLIDCLDPDCSSTCITGNLMNTFAATSANYEFFSYDPDPNCASGDWAANWTKFKAPDGFYMEIYDDGTAILSGRIENFTDNNDSWEVFMRLHNKRNWTEWSALGRMFYEFGTSPCSDNHVDWDYYEMDDTYSKWIGTPGSSNAGLVANLQHRPTDFSKGVQVGFGASNCTGCDCNIYNVRGWFSITGDLNLVCADYGSGLSGYKVGDDCNILNGGFEDGLEHWLTKPGVSSTTDAKEGSTAAIITDDNTTISKYLLPAEPGKVYAATIWSKITAAVGSASVEMQFFDGDWNVLAGYTVPVNATTYQEYIFGGKAPINTAYLTIRAWKGLGGSMYIDELCLDIIEDYTESDCQDIMNTNFEDDFSGNWNIWGTVNKTSDAYAGSSAALVTGNNSGLTQNIPVEEDKNYSFSVYVKETNIDDWTAVGLTWMDVNGNTIYVIQQDRFTSTYQEYQLVGTAPKGAVEAEIWGTKIGNGELYIDNNCFKVFARRTPIDICGNNLDDDGDGYVDNYDEDCCPKLNVIPQSNYSLHYADSEEAGFGAATNAFDGDSETYWHTDFDATTYPVPHEIQIDLGTTYKLGGFRYLPTRNIEDGRILNYEVYVSDDGNSWGAAVSTGVFTYDDLGDKEVSFPLVEGRYFRLRALSDVNSTGWTTAVEINVLECKGQETCDDGIDNDGDGLVDCEDPDCAADIEFSVTTATNCGDAIIISTNTCINYAQSLGHFIGNVTNESAAIDKPDGVGAFVNEISDGTYTRMIWDFGEVIPDGEEVCFRVQGTDVSTTSNVTIWLLNSGTPETGTFNIVSTQTFVGTTWQDLCFTMPRSSRYVKITDDAGAPFYVDAVGRKCRSIDNLAYSWNTGENSPSITVNGATTKTYTVTITSPGSCTATESISITGLTGCPEICGNGLDDDGDGFIDGGDSDCPTDCTESLLFVARDNGNILQVNLTTGATSIATTSPYTSYNLNALAANPDAEVVYYGIDKTIYYWNPKTGTHSPLVNLSGTVGTDESISSGGGAYFNGYLYMGFEDEYTSGDPTIYRIELAADGLSTIGSATNLNVPIPDYASWGDMIVSSESGNTIIYAGLGYNNTSNTSLYFSYKVETGIYQTIRTDMPSEFQIGIDVDGNLWGGALASGNIRKFDRATGNFYGNTVYIGGDLWDLTGPINCPQQIEICGNGLDDDGDGRIDSDDDDCDCPLIVTTDDKMHNICEGDPLTFSVVTDASNPPFTKVEFYRFETQQTNPYTTTDTKIWLGDFDNTDGMGSISTNNFPLNGISSLDYYIYAVVKPIPTDLNGCIPFIEYEINVDGCAEICDDGIDNDGDGDIDLLDVDCGGYCSDNGTFLSYGMLQLENFTTGTGLYSEELDLTFDFVDGLYLYWLAGDEFYLKGNVIAYQSGSYVGKYKLVYTATGATYSIFGNDNILGSTGGSGMLISTEPALTTYDNIVMGAQLNGAGWGLMVREYSNNDIRIEGDWGVDNWSGNNNVSAKVVIDDCSDPREICGNGEDDDNDGLLDCADPDCTNPNDGGTIDGNESNCGLYKPYEITEQVSPMNMGNGVPEYQWEVSTDNVIWTNIQGAVQVNYDPIAISQTTRYRRKVRMGDCNPWLTSNVVAKIVTPPTFTAEILNPPGNNGYLCATEEYIFEATTIDDGFYFWDFGALADPSTATGTGPHAVTFSIPSDSLPVTTEVTLNTIETTTFCVSADTVQFTIHPLPLITSADSDDPSACGLNDGWITLTVDGENDACFEISLDGGNTYEPQNQLTFNDLSSGSYEVVVRYCDENCPNVYQIISLSDPISITLTNDDFADVCPGFNYESNVLFNDAIQGETILEIQETANYGTVLLEPDGSFVYTPNTPTCDMDQFSYRVCDPGRNCCAIAVVTIDFNDDEAPDLVNVPDDLTVNCDDEIPLPPLVSAFDNCPAISIDKKEKNTQGEDGCSLYEYDITYTWIAKDFCGNEALDSQIVSVKDVTAPDIYRIYTLPNGKKMIAGVMENVTHHWKAIQLPIEFKTVPVIFTQLVTVNETRPVVARLRNISRNQFELKLQEENANDSARIGESVAWFAIEEGTQLTNYELEAATVDVGDDVESVNFQQVFSNMPAVFTTMQTILDKDPATVRYSNLTTSGVEFKLQEETSVDANVTHVKERLAYLAINSPILTNDIGDVFGESGQSIIDDNWTTISLTNKYINPVVVANCLSENEVDPAIVQIKNVTPTSFDIKINEWDYLDKVHVNEMVSYLVIEGSIPLNGDKFCEYGTDSLVLGVDIVVTDNCDPNVSITYNETEIISGPQKIISRSWSAIDECGNETTYYQDVICEGVLLRLKAVLQGASVYSKDGMMRDDLRRKGLIPLTEPYTKDINFNHVGEGGGERMEITMMDETGPNACVDWVFVELCDANDATKVVATCAGILQRDGDVMTAKGDTLIHFENVPPGDYFVALSHRNHLKTLSLNAYTFTPNSVPFVDFTYEFTPVIGIEPNVDITGTKALWSGDLNGDDKVIYQGPKNDVFYMFLHIVLDSLNSNYLTNFISSDYTNDDFNMDGTVIFQGPNNDKSALLFNTILRHPKNTENFSNFIISTEDNSNNFNDDEDRRPVISDFDGDGLLDIVDPDDDNDGVADGSDVEPFNANSDSDYDGIGDNTETGGNGLYEPSIDSDPLNPCDPIIAPNCIGIDNDEDGFYRNYPSNHLLYDIDDYNTCIPDVVNVNCICADDDGDGFVVICHKSTIGDVKPKTKRIPLSVLPAHLRHGDTCGPCNE